MPIDPNEYDYLNTSLIPALHTANPLESNIVDVENGISPHQDLERLLAPTPDPVTQELVQPPVAPPAFKGPSEDDKLAAAKVVLGTATPTGDGLVPQKTGETSTTTTKTTPSPESLQAVESMKQADLDAKAASDADAVAADELGKVQYEKAQAHANVVYSVENARAEVRQEKMGELQTTMQDLDNRVTELSNYQPETFWGSKSMADKITAGISVGLGAYGQALLGSGSNIGQVLLERNMGEFDRNQKAQYDAKLQGIQNMRADVQVKRQLVDDLDKTFDAQKLAANAQVDGKYAKAEAMAKTMQVKAGIGQRRAALAQKNAKDMADVTSKWETKITTTEQKDVIQRIARQNSPEVLKSNTKQIDDILAQNTKVAGVRAQIRSAMDQMRDPKISLDRKVGIGHDVLKAMNSSLGPDVVGNDEAKRGASELTPVTGDLIKKSTDMAVKGGGAGAVAGGFVPVIGPLIGGAAGAAGGALIGAVDALTEASSRSGGIHFTADPEAFAKRMELNLEKVDSMIRKNEAIAGLMRQGLTQTQATVLVDQQEAGTK